jgi:hypothetical protein
LWWWWQRGGGELQEQLLAREEKPAWREQAFFALEEKDGIAEKALIKVSVDLDAKRAKDEATQKEYLDKMETHIACAKHSLGLDKMMGEKKVELDGRKRDLDLCEAALAEAQSRGLNPWDNHEGLMEFCDDIPSVIVATTV